MVTFLMPMPNSSAANIDDPVNHHERIAMRQQSQNLSDLDDIESFATYSPSFRQQFFHLLFQRASDVHHRKRARQGRCTNVINGLIADGWSLTASTVVRSRRDPVAASDARGALNVPRRADQNLTRLGSERTRRPVN